MIDNNTLGTVIGVGVGLYVADKILNKPKNRVFKAEPRVKRALNYSKGSSKSSSHKKGMFF